MTAKLNLLSPILDQFVSLLTPEVAQRIAAERADETLQARLDVLADNANEGTLTVEEIDEYDTYLSALSIIAILQSKARRLVSRKTA